MNPLSAARPLALAALPLLALLLVAGCSTDTHVFYSTATAPKSVDVRYVQSGETAWSMDIPEGHELELDFDRPGEGLFRRMPDTPARKMKWELRPVSTGTDGRGAPVDNPQKRSGTEELNGLPVQMDVTLRQDRNPARGASGRRYEASAAPGGAG